MITNCLDTNLKDLCSQKPILLISAAQINYVGKVSANGDTLTLRLVEQMPVGEGVDHSVFMFCLTVAYTNLNRKLQVVNYMCGILELVWHMLRAYLLLP